MDVYLHFVNFDERLTQILKDLKQIKGDLKMALVTLDTLTQDVADETTLDASIIALLDNISAQLKAAGNDQAKLDALDAAINANKAAIAAAIQANTPAPPAV
jgi:hypothetical protein